MSFKLFQKDKKRRNDLIFISFLLIMLSLFGLLYSLCREKGSCVRVEVDGAFFGEYSLSSDREVEIRSKNGTNRLVIKDGRASVSEASCPDGICSSHRPVSRVGESIVCLPNKVVVTVAGENEDKVDIAA